MGTDVENAGLVKAAHTLIDTTGAWTMSLKRFISEIFIRGIKE